MKAQRVPGVDARVPPIGGFTAKAQGLPACRRTLGHAPSNWPNSERVQPVPGGSSATLTRFGERGRDGPQGSPLWRRTLGFDGLTPSGPSDSNCGSLEKSIVVMVSICGSPPVRLLFGDVVR